ncbi:hypothetical protein RI065_11665 [Mycoplasmatota bacterium zrk1]
MKKIIKTWYALNVIIFFAQPIFYFSLGIFRDYIYDVASLVFIIGESILCLTIIPINILILTRIKSMGVKEFYKGFSTFHRILFTLLVLINLVIAISMLSYAYLVYLSMYGS